MANVPLPQQRILHHVRQRRRDRKRDLERFALGLEAIEELDQGNVCFGDRLEEPAFLEKAVVLRMPDVGQMGVEDQEQISLRHEAILVDKKWASGLGDSACPGNMKSILQRLRWRPGTLPPGRPHASSRSDPATFRVPWRRWFVPSPHRRGPARCPRRSCSRWGSRARCLARSPTFPVRPRGWPRPDAARPRRRGSATTASYRDWARQ